jgi:hypothetical protein
MHPRAHCAAEASTMTTALATAAQNCTLLTISGLRQVLDANASYALRLNAR